SQLMTLAQAHRRLKNWLNCRSTSSK
ncbi:EAL domain protein, partial [Vibrio parahaemolyticus V-223/04]